MAAPKPNAAAPADSASPKDDEPSGHVSQLTAAWDVNGIEIETMHFERGTASLAADRSIVRPVDRVQRIRTLPALLEPGPEGTLAPFKLGDVLGEGGMGIVRSAEQTALEREVAVKSLQKGADPVRAAPQLLREARVTGTLEHPNVVPIYALGRDDSDSPLIVMKRIEGTSWLGMLERTADDRMEDANLRKQLGILRQVARAVHFAHTKGIVHRDIKPENVMIGAFGEVYVVDWGIAVSVAEDGLRGVPLAKDVSAIEGTPSYMAPEMAAGDGESIDIRSDVYLLGATLHEVITGQPPHDGNNLMMILTNAFASETKVYGDDVPIDLAKICQRAMNRFNDQRYASADEFGSALEEFLQHRSAMRLCDEASKRIVTLRSLLREHGTEELDEQLEHRLYMMFSEARFGFNQALQGWSGNQAAREGRREVLEMMIDFELSRGAPGAAAALLRELSDPPAKLAKRVQRAVDKQRSTSERLEKLELDSDLSFGERIRRSLTYMLAISWGLSVAGSGVLTRYEIFEVGHNWFAALNAVFLLASIASAVLTRDKMMANATNRRVTYTTLLGFGANVVVFVLLGSIGVSLPNTTLVACVMASLLWATAALNVHRSWSAMSIGKFVSFVGVWLWPVYHYEIFGLAGLMSSLVTASLWTGRDRDEADAQSSTLNERA